ncbi:hypothetical protein CBOM_00146 [Ceraceosorus bombacis]|uniref:Uncharacterized protein n=1 Tax=Ceraceosorus bombacis TaxID=401625 RepID=A0A0P1B865_9BASI|nr:hypothetical protein CBOM_00146 [Ceraceosorus bombacis]
MFVITLLFISLLSVVVGLRIRSRQHPGDDTVASDTMSAGVRRLLTASATIRILRDHGGESFLKMRSLQAALREYHENSKWLEDLNPVWRTRILSLIETIKNSSEGQKIFESTLKAASLQLTRPVFRKSVQSAPDALTFVFTQTAKDFYPTHNVSRDDVLLLDWVIQNLGINKHFRTELELYEHQVDRIFAWFAFQNRIRRSHRQKHIFPLKSGQPLPYRWQGRLGSFRTGQPQPSSVLPVTLAVAVASRPIL